MDIHLEITRRCNLRCDHCLRGGAQRVDVSDRVLYKVFQQWPTEYIGSVTFTGGEPSLVPDRIEKFRHELQYRGSILGFWELTTNAHYITEPFLTALEKLSWHVDEKDMCSIRISRDHFHRALSQQRSRWKLQEWGELTGIHIYEDKALDTFTEKIKGQGRAKRYQLGYDISDKHTPEWEYSLDDDGEISHTAGSVYVNAYGDIIDGCNWSWIEQKQHILGNVKHHKIASLLIKYGKAV